MFEKALLMYIYAETPMHPGSGIALGAVDLPIQRERHTEFPIIQGSSLKGVLRNVPKGAKNSGIALSDLCKNCPEKKDNMPKEVCELCGQIFGTQEGIGGVSVTDARMLAFPVRTLKGVFGWVTCPLVLDRYKRDLSLAGINSKWDIPKPTSNEEAKICKNNSNIAEKYVYIEDLQLKCTDDENVNKIAEEISNALPENDIYKEIKDKLKKDLVIVSDDVFRDLVTLTTEVVARIKIDPVKAIVETGALWSEEYLPMDTIMYSLILIPRLVKELSSNRLNEEIKKELEKIKEEPEKIEKILEKVYNEKILQIGGDETTGKGFARIKIVEGGRNAEKS